MEDLRTYSKTLHHEVIPVTRDSIQESLKSERKTLPYYSKYEYTVMLATRTQQLSEGAIPLSTLEGLRQSDPRFLEHVAKREILEQKLPFLVHRRLPNGVSEYWSATELSVIW
jgi:DNA-directed RNA polymerase subunit K/omega